jgi:hypothetical protein
MISIEKVFIVKLCYSFLVSLLIVFLYKKSHFLNHFAEQKGSILIAFILTRILPFIVVYLILNQTPRGDVPFFYWKASSVYEGKIVYKDFWSYHAPVFSYILTIPLLFWHSPKAIVLLLCVGEYICLMLTKKYYEKQDSSINSTKFSLIYLLLPAPFVIMLLGGQEDIWLWGIGVVAMMSYGRTKNLFLFSFILSIGLVVLKITFVLIFVPIFFSKHFKNKILLLAGSLALLIPVFGVTYYFVGTDFLMFIKHTETPFSPNFHSILHPFFFDFFKKFTLTQINWLGLGIIFILLIRLGLLIKNLDLNRIFPMVWIFCFGIMNVILPASMIYYVFIYLIVIWFYIIRKDDMKDVVLFLFFNILVIVQPYLFVKLGQKMYPDFSFIAEPLRLIEYLIQVWLVVYVCYYVRRAYQEIFRV